MSKSDLVYIVHIQRSINQIVEYTNGLKEEEFLSNQLIEDAVVRNFEIIGEAAKQISKEFRAKHSGIEWKKMAGMRDKLIHDYIEVDYAIIWATIQDILPDLKKKIQKIIEEYAT